MHIIIDTREHEKERKRIEKQFDNLGVTYERRKLDTGDYMSPENPMITIDRKKDLLELCGNVTQQHERFRRELERALHPKSGDPIKLIILCEHGEDIKRLEDVYFWENPRRKPTEWIMHDGHPCKVPKNEHATTGPQLYKSLCTIRDKYKVDFYFCTKDKTGSEIVRLLMR